MARHAIVTFFAIFLAELPDKTMFATLLLSTRFKRKLPVWIGVSAGYGLHVVIASRATDFDRQLRERGYEPIGVDLSELLLGGGGVKCCTLELRR